MDFVQIRQSLRRILIADGLTRWQAKAEAWRLSLAWLESSPQVQAEVVTEIEADLLQLRSSRC